MKNRLLLLTAVFATACEPNIVIPAIDREVQICGELEHKIQQLKQLADDRGFRFAYGTNPADFYGQLTVRMLSDDFELVLFNVSSPTTFTARVYPNDAQSDHQAVFDEIIADIASRLGEDC